MTLVVIKCNKMKHENVIDAVKHLTRLLPKQKSDKDRKALEVYLCWCGYWHVGHNRRTNDEPKSW